MLQNEVNALRDTPVATPTMIIGGQSVAAHSGQTLEVSSPVDGQTLTHIPNAGEHDVAAAVAAARTSFDAGVWARIAPAGRKKILLRWAELIELNALELAVLGVRDNGTEMSMAFKAEPLSAAGTIRYYAEAIDKIYGEVAPTDPSTLALILKEPVGVVGAIVPWNFPLMISAWKIAPALAMGNSVVLKPSEVASLSVLRMVALAHEAGLPEGVLNVITGEGPVSGRALARSMDVDALVFTGSVNVGRRLMEYAAQSNLKRVFLELGGKSPHIVFDDTQDIDTAAQAVVNGIFRNSGQVCIAGSRLLVLADTGGSYMQPTVVLDQQPDDPLVRNEIFGPVLTVTRFKKETDAVEMANASELGLAAGVWTNELGRAHRMISALRAGVVHVNTFGGADNTVPLGGFAYGNFKSECPPDKKVKIDDLFKFTRTRGDLHVSVVAAGIALFFLVFFWTQTGWDKRNLPDNILSYTAHQFGVIELDGRITRLGRILKQSWVAPVLCLLVLVPGDTDQHTGNTGQCPDHLRRLRHDTTRRSLTCALAGLLCVIFRRVFFYSVSLDRAVRLWSLLTRPWRTVRATRYHDGCDSRSGIVDSRAPPNHGPCSNAVRVWVSDRNDRTPVNPTNRPLHLRYRIPVLGFQPDCRHRWHLRTEPGTKPDGWQGRRPTRSPDYGWTADRLQGTCQQQSHSPLLCVLRHCHGDYPGCWRICCPVL